MKIMLCLPTLWNANPVMILFVRAKVYKRQLIYHCESCCYDNITKLNSVVMSNSQIILIMFFFCLFLLPIVG